MPLGRGRERRSAWFWWALVSGSTGVIRVGASWNVGKGRRVEQIRQWLRQAGCRRIRNTGTNDLISTCPFHEDRKPSFSINSTGAFVCYSQSCGVTGNIVNLLMGALHWSYARASAAMQEMDIPSLDDPSVYTLPPYERRKMRDLEVEETKIREGHLGLYDFCPKYMLQRGYPKALLRKWYVGYDYGTHRVTLPVRDGYGKLVGISKRATLETQDVKYLHLGFKKSNYLYGAHVTKRSRPVVVVEGHVDVLAWEMLRKLGITDFQCVATMGSQVSREQVRLLSRYDSVYLAFDNDSDGKAAMERVGEGLIRRMNPGKVRVLRGFPANCKDVGDVFERPDIPITEKRRFVSQFESYDSVRIEL